MKVDPSPSFFRERFPELMAYLIRRNDELFLLEPIPGAE
jgi:hypothetical protein